MLSSDGTPMSFPSVPSNHGIAEVNKWGVFSDLGTDLLSLETSIPCTCLEWMPTNTWSWLCFLSFKKSLLWRWVKERTLRILCSANITNQWFSSGRLTFNKANTQKGKWDSNDCLNCTWSTFLTWPRSRGNLICMFKLAGFACCIKGALFCNYRWKFFSLHISAGAI